MTATFLPTKHKIVSVIQGDHNISGDEEVVFSTVLGSCISVCMYDPVARVGGMNHYLLPDDGTLRPHEQKYGALSMELLINGLFRVGARRDRLKSKVFGGAQMNAGNSDIGERNAKFALSFLQREGFEIEAKFIGGQNALRAQFHAISGAARVMRVPKTEVVQARPKTPPVTPSGSVTLF